jgi:hypothetical protein
MSAEPTSCDKLWHATNAGCCAHARSGGLGGMRITAASETTSNTTMTPSNASITRSWTPGSHLSLRSRSCPSSAIVNQVRSNGDYRTARFMIVVIRQFGQLRIVHDHERGYRRYRREPAARLVRNRHWPSVTPAAVVCGRRRPTARPSRQDQARSPSPPTARTSGPADQRTSPSEL